MFAVHTMKHFIVEGSKPKYKHALTPFSCWLCFAKAQAPGDSCSTHSLHNRQSDMHLVLVQKLSCFEQLHVVQNMK